MVLVGCYLRKVSKAQQRWTKQRQKNKPSAPFARWKKDRERKKTLVNIQNMERFELADKQFWKRPNKNKHSWILSARESQWAQLTMEKPLKNYVRSFCECLLRCCIYSLCDSCTFFSIGLLLLLLPYFQRQTIFAWAK